MNRTPTEKEIEKWLKEDVTIYLLNSLAKKMNELDTIRGLTSENHIDKLADKKALEVIESFFYDVYKELPKLQHKLAKDEFGIPKIIREFESSDY